MSARPFEKALPQAPDAERAVLGSILINNGALWRVVDRVRSDDFFASGDTSPNRIVFATMCEMAERGIDIDPLTLKDELRKRGLLEKVGGVVYLSELVGVVPDVANVERYATIVRERATARSLMLLGNSLVSHASGSGDVQSLLAEAEADIFALAEGVQVANAEHLGAIARSSLAYVEEVRESGKAVTGIPTQFPTLNHLTAGLHPGQLIIVAARPAMGKTSLMLNLAEYVGVPRPSGDVSYRVGLFSLEMSKDELGARMLASVAGVDSQRMRAGILSAAELERLREATKTLAHSLVYIDDTPALDILDLRARARRMKSERGLDLVLVDYLQLMTVKGRSESRQVEISKISGGLKALAKELRIPVIALAQLSRRPEQRTGDHRPQLSDLRESGSIEQDADVVMFLYRDIVYNSEADPAGAELIIAKQRSGPTGDVPLVFLGAQTKFFEASRVDIEQEVA